MMVHPISIPALTKEQEERFWAKVNLTETCWLWTAAINLDGYGHFKIAGTMRKAHRVSYQLFYGEVPTGKILHHECEIRKCVNPFHLHPLSISEHCKFTQSGHGHPRKSCPVGHLMDDSNTIRHLGHRICATCLESHRDENNIVVGENQFSFNGTTPSIVTRMIQQIKNQLETKEAA